MKPKEPIYQDPTSDDSIDMEMPPADHISNRIVLVCFWATIVLFASIAGVCISRFQL